MKNYEAVIFDLDGTLVDSMWVWNKIDIDFLDSRNLDLPEDLQNQIEGMSFTETAEYFKKRFNLKESIEEIKIDWNTRAYDYYNDKVKVKQGVIPFLKYLKLNDIKIGLGTSNSKELAIATLKSNNIFEYFDIVKTSCEVNKGKPNPDIFLKVAEELNVNANKCLVFEDTLAGVKAGKAAGMDVIGIYDESSHDRQDAISEIALEILKNYNKFTD